MTKELNHREQYVYDQQDQLGLKELARELGININSVVNMKEKANRFYGRTARKKRANKKPF